LPAVADGTEAFAAVAVVTPTAKSPAVSTAAGITFRRIDRPWLLVTVTVRSESLLRGVEFMTSPCLCVPIKFLIQEAFSNASKPKKLVLSPPAARAGRVS
jgi:hypothetical protein